MNSPGILTASVPRLAILIGMLILASGCDELIKRRPSAETPEQAADTAYQMCAGCHGPKGLRVNLMPPRIWGQNEKYLISALTAYRDKTRIQPIMNSITANYSDEPCPMRDEPEGRGVIPS